MASINEKTRKSGVVSYEIRVSLGRDLNDKQIIKTCTWTPEPEMTKKQIDKALEREAVLFEERCRSVELLDTSTRFADFAELWLERKKDIHSPKYQNRVRYCLARINQAIGHLKISAIKPYHIQAFVENLQEPGIKKVALSAASPSLAGVLQERNISRGALSKLSGIPQSTTAAAIRGKSIRRESAEKLSKALKTPFSKLFIVDVKQEFLSIESVKYHHRVINAIFESAVKWQVIYDNPARRVELPKAQKKAAAYLDDKQALEVVNALSSAPLKYRTALMLLLYSGMRRGELCGLTWNDVDFDNGIIHITKSNQYLPGRGVFEKETKTESSNRSIRLPKEMFALLKEYREWQARERIKAGNLWIECGKVFTQDLGKPMHPDSLSKWVAKFREENNLPYFTPHTLRHTSATLLIMQGVNPRTVAGRLGHANQNTTNMIYSHAIRTMDAMASYVLGDVFKPADKKPSNNRVG